MKKSEFKEFVKEMFIDLIENDDEVRDIVLEFVQENAGLLTESKAPKEPDDPELYDKLMMIASGQEKKLIYEGKLISPPNYGNGFKSGKNIKEWANKTYSSIGGKWRTASPSSDQGFGIRGETLSFLSAMGGGDSAGLRNIASSGNDRVIKESILQSGGGKMMALDEYGNFDPNKNIDISDVLVDTAKTTLQHFPASHEGQAGVSGPSGKESFHGTPEQVFGESAGNWAALAFQGMDLGE